jgi:hypothetical protein
MSLYIRHLPGKPEMLIDKSKFPNNVVLFNPSADGPYIYIRTNQHSPTCETNSITIFNQDNNKLHLIGPPMDILKPNANLFKGIEDLRIVVFEGQIWFTATTTHASDNMTNELLFGCLDRDLQRVIDMSVVDIGVLPVKNVCPFVWQDKIFLLDAYLRKIYNVAKDPDTGKFVATVEKDLILAMGVPDKKYRGSTSPIHLHGNTWGFIVHDIIFNDDIRLVTRLAYFHHWVEMDVVRGVITFVSAPFWCTTWGIEYISGIRMKQKDNPGKNKIELYMGVHDENAVLFETTIEDLRIGK